MEKSLISVIGGLSGMFGWGVSDFFANTSSEKYGHTKTFFWSQIFGLLLMAIVFIIFSGKNTFTSTSLLLLIIAAFAYSVGYLYFYKGFEIGNVSVVSSVVNIQQLIVIAISFFIFKQSISVFQLLGILAIMTGVTLVSVNFNDLKSKNLVLAKGVKETLFSSLLFGAIFWPFSEYLTENNDWIAVSFYIKILAVAITYFFAKINKEDIASPGTNLKVLGLFALVGILEALAVLGVSFGQAYGDLIIVSPLSSALTIVTVSLAVIFLKEKLTRQQVIGIITTISGVIFTAF